MGRFLCGLKSLCPFVYLYLLFFRLLIPVSLPPSFKVQTLDFVCDRAEGPGISHIMNECILSQNFI